jgi:hypothetical protein
MEKKFDDESAVIVNGEKIWCGPRGLWFCPDTNDYILQVIKMIEHVDGTWSEFVLNKVGEWIPVKPGMPFGKDITMHIYLTGAGSGKEI